jgi:hypothetical protein
MLRRTTHFPGWLVRCSGLRSCHVRFGPIESVNLGRSGGYKIHDLENIGDTDLWFTTVEFLDSAKEPLEINAITDPR